MSRVLVVDDHAIVRSGVRRLLADMPGLALREAASGEEALDQVRDHVFDLIILDLNLPGVGGLELLRRILKSNSKLAVLVFSAHTEAIYANRALEAGARGFISKGAAPEEFLAAVQSVLAGGTVVEATPEQRAEWAKNLPPVWAQIAKDTGPEGEKFLALMEAGKKACPK